MLIGCRLDFVNDRQIGTTNAPPFPPRRSLLKPSSFVPNEQNSLYYVCDHFELMVTGSSNGVEVGHFGSHGFDRGLEETDPEFDVVDFAALFIFINGIHCPLCSTENVMTFPLGTLNVGMIILGGTNKTGNVWEGRVVRACTISKVHVTTSFRHHMRPHKNPNSIKEGIQ